MFSVPGVNQITGLGKKKLKFLVFKRFFSVNQCTEGVKWAPVPSARRGGKKVAVTHLSHLDSPWWWPHDSQPKAAIRVWERVRIKKAIKSGAPGTLELQKACQGEHSTAPTLLPSHLLHLDYPQWQSKGEKPPLKNGIIRSWLSYLRLWPGKCLQTPLFPNLLSLGIRLM